MPQRNGTGPSGQGPMTGRGLGFCVTGIRRLFGRRTNVTGSTGNYGAAPGAGFGTGYGAARGGRGRGGGRGQGQGRGRR